MFMGIADVVPGVSGGTIAIITGIYEELLRTINGINLKIYNDYKELGIKNVWIKYNFCLLYTSPSPRDMRRSRMPSSA